MNDCLHNKTSNFNAKKEFAGHVFTYKTKKCDACDAVLWTKEIQVKFNKWLNELRSDNFFTVQKLQLSPKTLSFVESIASEKTLTFSAVIKGTLAFYCNVVLPNEDLVDFTNEAFEQLKKHGDEKSVKVAENKKVRLSANLFQSAHGFAELGEYGSVTSFVQDAVERALAPVLLARIELEEIKQPSFSSSLEACLVAAA